VGKANSLIAMRYGDQIFLPMGAKHNVKNVQKSRSNQIATNGWLYGFGFALHIFSFKPQKPIGKTDIYNVLAIWRDY